MKRTTNPKVAALAALASLGACAPMEQAPLVYASKNQIGAHVTAGAPESPGFEISLGYKGMDAAFVPVAVAKYCDSASAAECEDEIYAMTTVTAENTMGGGTSVNAEAIEVLDGRMAVRQVQIDSLKPQIAADERLKAVNEKELGRLDGLKKELTDIEAIAEAELTEVQRKRKEELPAQIGAIEALEKPADIAARLQNRQRELDSLEDIQAADGQDRRRLLSTRNAQSQDLKRDAFSVYGSFDGQTGGDKGSASLSLGKVFSTGVAAQNLTQGIRQASRVTQTIACLRTLDVLAERLPKAKQEDFLMKTRGLCTDTEADFRASSE